MDFCGSCGILLESKGASLCKTCHLISTQPNGGSSCICAYCMCKSGKPVKETHIPFQTKKFQAGESSSDNQTRGINLKDSQVDEEIRKQWETEQLELKRKLLTEDDDIVKEILHSFPFDPRDADITCQYYIGGVDISFVKGDSVNACAAFVVLSFPDLKVVYEDYQMIQLTAPYIPGFLAFREASFIVQQYQQLIKTKPQFAPHVIFVDGNGVLHPRGFGLASHLGVLLDIPCVGVAKTLIHVDGLENDEVHKERKGILQGRGDTFLLQDSHGNILGKALKSCDNTKNPIYVSIGHKISLDSAVSLVSECCKYRIPEPTRQADLNSREYLRKNFGTVAED